MLRFGVIGVAGFVARRHLAAIEAIGGEVRAACDPHDSVGALDRVAPDAAFFTRERAFFRALGASPVDVVTICTPNDLHVAHAIDALRADASVLCEKPLALTIRDLDRLAAAEQRSRRRVWTVLQLRCHPTLEALARERSSTRAGRRAVVALDYVTPRGAWYAASWKGDAARSGGLGFNVGVHLFDLLGWLFGRCERVALRSVGPTRIVGELTLVGADVLFTLSIDRADARPSGSMTARRVLTIDGATIDFTQGIETLHDEVYRRLAAAVGVGVEDARSGIEIAAAVRSAVERAPR